MAKSKHVLCRFLAQTELSGQKPDVPSLRLRRAVQMIGQKLSTESVGNVVGKKSEPERKRKSPKKAPQRPRPVFSVPFKTGRATPDIAV